MKKVLIAMTIGIAAGLLLGPSPVQAECSAEDWTGCAGKPWVDGEVMETPIGSKWWPNPLWGAEDEAGSTNWYTKPEVVKRGLEQIKLGKVYSLGQPYTSDMPLFGERTFSLRIPATPSGGPFGANKLVYHDDFLATEISQVGTQFDGLGHIGVQIGVDGDRNNMRWYNGFTNTEVGSAYGLKKLGTEKLHPIIARGILIDLAAVLGDMEMGQAATMADVRTALKRQGMEDFEFKEGDAILFRYGWERHWTNPDQFSAGCPGVTMEVARWLAEDVKAGVTGGDTWPGTDPVPYPDEPACGFCVHSYLQARHGIVNQENMALKQLADDGVYVFAYIFSPVPIVGATGSIGAPLAIH
jgi:kynurenine formamidase